MLNKKAYAEAFYLINEMSEEMRSKIPEKIMKNIQDRMDKEYEFHFDEENIELLEDTEKILSVLYTDYFSTDEEREVILNKEKILADSKKVKEIHDVKIHDVFSEKIENKKDNENIEIVNELIETQEKWYEKIFNFIKKFFN